jgi:anti-sigma factor RsiW
MKCAEFKLLQDAFADSELDPDAMRDAAEHGNACPACAAGLLDLQKLREAIKANATRHALPRDVEGKILQSVAAAQREQRQPAPHVRPWQWGGAGAGLALAACLAFFMMMRPDEQYMLEQQLIADHIRSLQDGHLTDVISTDQHTVKPWFNGRLDLSPPVIDLAADGFVLVGGRLDYADHRAIAAIVYRANAHVINLFVFPSAHRLDAGAFAAQQGYAARHWQDNDLQFWIISDINPARLAEFENLFRARYNAAR